MNGRAKLDGWGCSSNAAQQLVIWFWPWMVCHAERADGVEALAFATALSPRRTLIGEMRTPTRPTPTDRPLATSAFLDPLLPFRAATLGGALEVRVLALATLAAFTPLSLACPG